MGANGFREERRRRIVEVATELADQGYDAVRMQDLRDRAGVALGTLYADFPSKNMVILEVMTDWMGALVEEQVAAGIVGDTPTERVEWVLFGLLDRSLEYPTRLRTCVQAFVMPEPMGIEPVGRLERVFGRALFEAIGEEVGMESRIDATRVIGGVWLASFVAWMTERRDEDHIRDLLRSGIRTSLR